MAKVAYFSETQGKIILWITYLSSSTYRQVNWYALLLPTGKLIDIHYSYSILQWNILHILYQWCRLSQHTYTLLLLILLYTSFTNVTINVLILRHAGDHDAFNRLHLFWAQVSWYSTQWAENKLTFLLEIGACSMMGRRGSEPGLWQRCRCVPVQ